MDTETSSLDAIRADLVGVSLALGPNDACYIPLSHGGTDMFAQKPEQVPLADAIALLKPLLEDEAVLKVFQNGKYDLILPSNTILFASGQHDITDQVTKALDAAMK